MLHYTNDHVGYAFKLSVVIYGYHVMVPDFKSLVLFKVLQPLHDLSMQICLLELIYVFVIAIS